MSNESGICCCGGQAMNHLTVTVNGDKKYGKLCDNCKALVISDHVDGPYICRCGTWSQSSTITIPHGSVRFIDETAPPSPEIKQTMSKTITIEIPAPPNGWAYAKRIPQYGESYMFFDYDHWTEAEERKHYTEDTMLTGTYAFSVRDKYAERYEALALKWPDGWVWTSTGPTSSDKPSVEFSESYPPSSLERDYPTLRRIINGTAYKPGEELK